MDGALLPHGWGYLPPAVYYVKTVFFMTAADGIDSAVASHRGMYLARICSMT